MYWMRVHVSSAWPTAPGAAAVVAQLDDRRLIESFDVVSKGLMEHRLVHGVRHKHDDSRIETVTEFNDEGDDAIASSLKKWLHRLHDERNRLLHDAWFVGWGNEQTEDWSTAELSREQVRSQRSFARRSITADELRSLSEEAKAASKVAQRFWSRRRFGMDLRGKWVVAGRLVHESGDTTPSE